MAIMIPSAKITQRNEDPTALSPATGISVLALSTPNPLMIAIMEMIIPKIMLLMDETIMSFMLKSSRR